MQVSVAGSQLVCLSVTSEILIIKFNCAPPLWGLSGILRGSKPREVFRTETGVHAPPSGGGGVKKFPWPSTNGLVPRPV